MFIVNQDRDTTINLNNVKEIFVSQERMPKGSDVQCYGYYTSYNGTRWYYVAYGNLTGFCSSAYLKRA